MSNKASMTNNVSRYVICRKTGNCLWPLNDESKLQFDEKNNKTEKFEKCLKMYIIDFKTKGYKLTNWFG